MPRYVILQHETPTGLHFDFMLEMDAVLKTWSLPQPPAAGLELDAQILPDHRPSYLDYEGKISGNRGSVVRWDRGTYKIENNSPSELIVQISGEKLAGHVSLRQSPQEQNRWLFHFVA